jgi:formylglycine-generating enzyme required for sulfatase activity
LRNQRTGPGHQDNFVYTATVDSMSTNPLGLYHLEGNVSEWGWDASGERRWYRGTSWRKANARDLSPAYRGGEDSVRMLDDVGFRRVIETQPESR